MIIQIEIDAWPEYCGSCTILDRNLSKTKGGCGAFDRILKMTQWDDYIRCEECLEAEIKESD